MAYNNPRPRDAPARPAYGHQHPQHAPALSHQYGQEHYYNGMDEQNWAYGDQNRYDERPQYPHQQYEQPYGNINRGPRRSEPQGNMYTESPGYGVPQHQVPPQSGRYVPQSGYQESPMSEYLPQSDFPINNGYHAAQRQLPQQQPHYSGVNAYYEGPPQPTSGAYSRQDSYRGPESRQLQLQGSYRHEDGYFDDRHQRPSLDIPDPAGMRRSHEQTPQVTAHGYVSNDSPGSASRANFVTLSYPTQSPRVKKVQPMKPGS